MDRECTLHLFLFPGVSIESRYDPSNGFKQALTFTGQIDDPATPYEFRSPPRFHGKRVYMTITAPPHPRFREVMRAEGVEHACGSVEIKAGAEPEKFKYEDGEGEIEPFQISLQVTAEVLTAITLQVSGNNGRPLTAKVKLVGNRLPEPAGLNVSLDELDVSKNTRYVVGCFEIAAMTGLAPPGTTKP
jgi:hypothetical protein